MTHPIRIIFLYEEMDILSELFNAAIDDGKKIEFNFWRERTELAKKITVACWLVEERESSCVIECWEEFETDACWFFSNLNLNQSSCSLPLFSPSPSVTSHYLLWRIYVHLMCLLFFFLRSTFRSPVCTQNRSNVLFMDSIIGCFIPLWSYRLHKEEIMCFPSSFWHRLLSLK